MPGINTHKGVINLKKLALAVAISLAAIVVACGGDDDDEATTAPTSAAASSSALPNATDDDAREGFSSSQLPISVTIDVKAGSFEVPTGADLPDLFAIAETGGSGGYIDFVQPTHVYTYTSETESELGDPPTDYVQWFNGLPYPTIVDTQDVTVGGLSGTRLEIKNADNEPFGIFKLSDGSDYDINYTGSGSLYAYV
jgi:hypothetical protein